MRDWPQFQEPREHTIVDFECLGAGQTGPYGPSRREYIMRFTRLKDGKPCIGWTPPRSVVLAFLQAEVLPYHIETMPNGDVIPSGSQGLGTYSLDLMERVDPSTWHVRVVMPYDD
jgi:hypothetical protein